MSKQIKTTIQAKGLSIALHSTSQADYISLTDIAKYRSNAPADVVKNWMRSREPIEFLGLWEQLNNPDFKLVEFDPFRADAGRNSFVLSPQKWIAVTGAIGIQSKSGRYGSTFAHVDIAMEFASWVSPESNLYIIKDYQLHKKDKSHKLSLAWNVKCELDKSNFKDKNINI